MDVFILRFGTCVFASSSPSLSPKPPATSHHISTRQIHPSLQPKYLTSTATNLFKMSGLLGNDKKQQEGGVADGATGVAKTGTGSEFPPTSILPTSRPIRQSLTPLSSIGEHFERCYQYSGWSCRRCLPRGRRDGKCCHWRCWQAPRRWRLQHWHQRRGNRSGCGQDGA